MKFSLSRFEAILFFLPLLMSAKNFGQTTPAEDALLLGLLLYLVVFVISFFASMLNISQPLPSLRNFNLVMCIPFLGLVVLGLFVYIPLGLGLGLILLLNGLFIYLSYTRNSASVQPENKPNDETAA